MALQDPNSDRRSPAKERHGLLSPAAWWLLGLSVVAVVFFSLAVFATPNARPSQVPRLIVVLLWSLVVSPGGLSAFGFAFLVPFGMFLIVLATAAKILRGKARQKALGVVGYLSAAVRLRVPLPPYLRAASASEGFAMGRRLRRSAAMLERGVTLGDTLRVTAGELPPLMLDRIIAAEQTIAPGNALAEAIDRQRLLFATRETTSPVPGYAIITVCLILFVNMMVMVFIVPKYAQIFRDFGLRLPPITQALIDLSYGVAVSAEAYSVFILVAMMTAAVLFSRSIARALAGSSKSDVPEWLRRAAGRGIWVTPVIGRIVRDRQHALVCEALAEALRAGRPMPEAIGLATLPALNVVLFERMAAWRTGVETGQPTAVAARAAKLPRLLGELLAGQAVHERDNAAGAVEFAGRAYAARAVRAFAAVSAVVPVATTLLLAAAVAFVALAMFTPIVTLIDSLG